MFVKDKSNDNNLKRRIATPADMKKLRTTGFECFTVFVIRCAMHGPKAAARHSR
jgi:hypothetical protein